MARQQQPKEEKIPIVVSIKTGLARKDKAIMRKFAADYKGTVGEVIDNIVTQREMSADERDLAKSVEREMTSNDYTIVINGRNAKPDEDCLKYLEEKKCKLPNQQEVTYNALEIEVSSVQEGGLGYRLY
jgi:hypothetical protein